MKLQYLGDSKDCFKWDYHDYLMNALGLKVLNVLPMMTPNDESNHGNTKPEKFPARKEIIDFCNMLREERDISKIKTLPTIIGGDYEVILHKPEARISQKDRESYFEDIANHDKQLIFIDPDNGLEPESRFNEKHIRYSELRSILSQMTEDSLLIIFQHFRRKKFEEDFERIKERILEIMPNVNVVAIYWDQLMFVIVGKSKNLIEKVLEVNKKYQQTYPVEVLF